jgi:hypothetical protein
VTDLFDQKRLEEKSAAHDREINRIRRANQLVVKEFKETNLQLQKQARFRTFTPPSTAAKIRYPLILFW